MEKMNIIKNKVSIDFANKVLLETKFIFKNQNLMKISNANNLFQYEMNENILIWTSAHFCQS